MKPLRLAIRAGIASLLFNVIALPLRGATPVDLEVVRILQPGASSGGLYVGNRDPLAPVPLMKLPIGSITPLGWVRHMLELERDGMTGRLKEISPWLDLTKSAWASKTGLGERGWEELPYWLKGYGDLGYVLKDERLLAEARRWIEPVLASQREDGFFGPRDLLTSLNGKPDLWPHMVMLNVLQSYFEFSNDPRILPCLTKYFRWENTLPATAFGEGYWPKIRAGDNLESLHWLYNRVPEPWLLDLARKIHEHMARWDQDVIDWHNVNIAQGFRAPAMFYPQSKNPAHLEAAERNYAKVMGIYGQFPGGGFAADENARPGYVDPRQGFETCGIVEFMHSFELLTRISGNPLWADRCEDIAFNAFPASLTPELKGLHYLTCANQIQLDRHNKAPDVQNGGTMFSYSPYEVYRCCQHNVSHGWPYYAEELWLATFDRGLCASLYAPAEVQAKVGDGATVKITEATDYPFGDIVRLVLTPAQPVKFPLYLRLPRWCQNPTVKLNGRRMEVKTQPLAYLRIERLWSAGDTLVLTLPRRITTCVWEKNKNSVSVNYGPLTFSLKIAERWQSDKTRNPDWPDWEVFPASPWNYGLELDAKNPSVAFKIQRQRGPLNPQPWTPETAPLSLRVKARKIPAWQADRLNAVGLLQPSPAKSTEPEETITLIPMGAARLRIASFPTIGHGPDATEWVTKPASPINASHCGEADTVDAVNDGVEPKSSGDQNLPRFTWWDHRGTQEWIEWNFAKKRVVSATEVYWFDDSGRGQCRVPKSWKLLYRLGERWLPVDDASEFGVQPDKYNRASFKPVECEGLRLEVQLQPQFSAGILEWKNP